MELQTDRNLVDEFDNLHRIKKEMDEKIERLRRELINLAVQKNTNILFGTHKKCSIKEYEKVVYPENKEFFSKLIKKNGLFDAFSQINYSRLSPVIVKKDISINKEIFDAIKIIKDFRVSLIDRGI